MKSARSHIFMFGMVIPIVIAVCCSLSIAADATKTISNTSDPVNNDLQRTKEQISKISRIGKITKAENGELILEFDQGEESVSKTSPPEIRQAREMLAVAKQMELQAEQELAAVKSAPNPAAAQVMMRSAQLKAQATREFVEKIAGRLQQAYVEKSSNSTAGRSPSINLFREGMALKQLKAAKSLSDAGFNTGAVYDGSSPEIDYDPLKQQLRTRTGEVIDVQPISRIFRGNAPLFEEVRVPGSSRPITQLNPEVKRALATPNAKKVGGVDLQVTLDLLSFLGVADFRQQGPAIYIKSPVLISLSGLYTRAKQYTAEWGNLPAELRYPGSIERIYGFILDPENKDIFLVGAHASKPERQIDIDSIAIIIQTVWLKGLTPAVSLDPLPDNFSGPQYSRVIDIPKDSVVAKIMLDADYLMKRITFGVLTVPEALFESLAQMYTRDIDAGINPMSSSSRMWIYPMPISKGKIQVSTSGRSVLFDTRVMALTETGRITTNGFIEDGKRSEYDERVAKSFTDVYDILENSLEIEPRGIYVRLHGLVDLVTVGKFLREAEIDYPVLTNFSALPVRQLRGIESVPAYYPGVQVALKGKDTQYNYYISGGVLARPRVAARMLDRYQDATTLQLEAAVKTFPRKETFFKTLQLEFSVSRSESESRWEAERLLEKGEREISKRNYETAQATLRDVTRIDPFYSDAWAFLAQAESFLGHHREAADFIDRAIKLEPNETAFRLIALDVMLRADPKLDISLQDEQLCVQLSQEYSERARTALSLNRFDAAKKHADMAIRLYDDNADAYFYRAIARENGDQQATKDWIEAIRGYQRLIQENKGEQWKQRFAFALANRAWIRIGATARLTVERSLVELMQAEEEARKARALDSSQPLGLVFEVMARSLRAGLYKKQGLTPDLNITRQLADQLIQQFPDFSLAHLCRGMLLAESDALDAALIDLNETLRLDPISSVALNYRAKVYASKNMCKEAQADVNVLSSLGEQVDPDVAKTIAPCNHQ